MALHMDAATIYRNVRKALGHSVAYMVAAGCRYPSITPNVTEKLLDSMRVNGIDRYKFFRSGYYVDMPCSNFNSSFDVYRFYAYGIYGKAWKRRKLGIPTTCIIFAESSLKHDLSLYGSCRSIIQNTILNDQISSSDIYEYFKGNTKKLQPTTRKSRQIKTTPDDTVCGLVHMDYYNGSMQIDKLNTTKDKEETIFYARDDETEQVVSVVETEKGHKPAKTNHCTADNFETLSRKDVIEKIRGKRLDSYNKRALMLMRRLMRTDIHVTDIRITYAKKYYHKKEYVVYALYAIVFYDNRRPVVKYFDFFGGIAYTEYNYRFKNGKATQTDYVRLSKVKNRKIDIYSNKLKYEKSQKHVAA